MEDIDFSDEFCRFLKASIPGVAAAELLLLLHQHRDQTFTPEEAVTALGAGLTLRDAGQYLEKFAAESLVAVEQGRYRFRDSSTSPMVARLEQAFSQRPVTLIRIIYALRDSKIQTFADAFKLNRT